MKTHSPLIPFKLPDDPSLVIKEPLKFTQEELEKLTITLMGYKFISFGNALICPECGVQQGVLTNHAPDGEVNFYLRFNCECYKKQDDEAKQDLGKLEAPATEEQHPQEPPQNPE